MIVDTDVMRIGRNRMRPDSSTAAMVSSRSEEHTSELQSQSNLVCRLLLEKKKKKEQLRYKIVKKTEHPKHRHHLGRCGEETSTRKIGTTLGCLRRYTLFIACRAYSLRICT